MARPRIIMIDDQYGGEEKKGRHALREDLCSTVGLKDVTGDVATIDVENPAANAVFCRGQVVEDGQIRNDLAGTLQTIREGWQAWPRWALILLDMQFITGPVGDDGEPKGGTGNGKPDSYFGLTILEELWRDEALREIPVVILSAMPREQIERRFVEHGVFDFVDKTELNRDCLERLLLDYGLIESESMIGRSVEFLKCLREARRRARMGNDNVLLLGESGTGKELLARYVHDCSPRNQRAYITVYTQGVPNTLIDDRLFGHEKGAFTGAQSAQPGAAEEADGGTLFIDEFGDIPAEVQPKLLRLLDKNTRESQRTGAKADGIRKLDLQVILATNHIDILEQNDFRKDLLFRVRIADAIRVPPLEERHEDIPLLVEHFVRKAERAFAKTLSPERRTVNSEAMAKLSEASWPGNVRELEHAIESAVYRFPKLRVLSPGHLRLPAVAHGVTTTGAGISSRSYEPRLQFSEKSLPEILKNLSSLDLSDSTVDRHQWAGRLPELQASFARAAASLLKAALLATRKPTAENPEGELKIHPAVKLAMGDDKITASKAADIVKRVLSMDAKVCGQLVNDPVLNEAYETAIRLRPKSSKRKKELQEATS